MLIHSLARDAGLAATPPIAGSRSGLCAGTRVMTLNGHIPVEHLTPGDSVITRNGTRELVAVHSFWLLDSPVLVRKGSLGANRPAVDLMVGPDQTLHQQDKAGGNTSVAAAHRLIDDTRLIWSDHSGEMQVYQLEFDDYYTFYAEGIEVVSHLPGHLTPAIAAE